jgi:two-component system, cell cycle sensor histidine kinase and response regulator CckA
MSRADVRPYTGGLIRALVLSVAAAVVPVAGTFLFPDHLQDYEALTWLLLLVPAFLWAYERGWQGVATALAAGMATLSTTYAFAEIAGRQVPDLLLAVVVVYVAVTMGIGLFGDRVGKARVNEAVETLALQDPLTGLPNRRHADMHAAMQFAAAERGGGMAVVLFDLDDFSSFNERIGRGAGDEVLRRFAAMLREQTRRMDLAARYGPEEFVSVLSGCSEQGAVVFAARLQERLREGVNSGAVPTVSAGVACYRPDMQSVEELLQAAESALLLAKSDGRDRLRVHGRSTSEAPRPRQSATAGGGSGATSGVTAGGTPRVGEGRRVFVLVADAATRDELVSFLCRHQFAVTAAKAPEDTLLPLRHDFDLIVADVGAQARTVADMVAEVRRRMPSTRVLGVPLRDGGRVVPESLRVRVDGYYLGLSDPAAVLRQLAEMLEERDGLRENRLRQQVMSDELRALDRQARLALAASEAKYRHVVQSVQEVIFSTDAEGRWTFLNPAWTAITGFAIDESMGQPLFSYLHPDEAPVVRAQFMAALGQRLPGFRHEGRWRTQSGTLRWIELRLQPDVAPSGSLAGTTGVLADVTERRRAEDALQRSEEYFRSLIENSGDMMAVLNADATFRYVSPAVERVFGYVADDLLGADPLKLVHGEDLEDTRAGLAVVLDGPGVTRTAELRVRNRAGEWRHVEVTCRNLLLTRGVDGIVMNARDVTERHHAEAALRESEAILLRAQKMDAIGRLAGGVAHDFNNLLTTIEGHIDLLLADLPEGSPIHEELQEVRQAATRATSLTRQLLAFSRRQVLQPRVVQLNAIVRDLGKMLRRVIGEDVRLSTELPDDAGCVRADPTQIEQVLLNLVVNARDAMPRGGTVVISTSRRDFTPAEASVAEITPGTYVLLRVVDDGTGMPPEVAAQAFDPFFTTKGPGGGTGLGLSTVYGIAKQSGGHVWLRSVPGEGTEVVVCLPATPDALPEALQEAEAAEPARALAGERETVLLVEDEKAVRDLTHRILQRYGYEVVAASSAREALEHLADPGFRVDLLLTDVVMPEMGGQELAAVARTRRPGLPVLFISGYNEDAVLHDGILVEGASFLGKPFTPAVLLQRIQGILHPGAPRDGVDPGVQVTE